MDDISKQSVSLEDAFFAEQDARLLEKMRAKAAQQEQRDALRSVIGPVPRAN